MIVFHRQEYEELWLTIRSSESLVLIDTGYIEDYFGTDGQLSLHNMDEDTRTPIPMSEDIDITPGTPNDAFTGFVLLSGLPNGLYQVEGRVRDSIGNYRILSAFQNPNGEEDVTLFEIEITPLEITVRVAKDAEITFVDTPSLQMVVTLTPEAEIVMADLAIEATLEWIDDKLGEIILIDGYDMAIEFIDQGELDIINVYIK